MAMVATGMGGYGTSLSDEKEAGNGFEFTRRKKWPLLLLAELAGSALFCLKPVISHSSQMDPQGRMTTSLSWKVIYISPGSGEMLSQKSSDLESTNFLELVYPADRPHITTLFQSLVTPPLPLNSASSSTENLNGGIPTVIGGKSHTTYARIIHPSASTGMKLNGHKVPGGTSTVLWEIRCHATGVENGISGNTGLQNGMYGQNVSNPQFKLDGSGTVIPQNPHQFPQQQQQQQQNHQQQQQQSQKQKQGQGNANQSSSSDSSSGSGSGSNGDDSYKGKAIWLMGRQIGDSVGEDNSQSLDAFLELKLENEKLREELKELQMEITDEDFQTARSYINPAPLSPTSSSSPSESEASSSSSSTPINLHLPIKPKKPRLFKDSKPGEREKKRPKKSSIPNSTGIHQNAGGGAGGGGGGGGGGDGHVCVTCGRTDSPEWRKGPLGPKTLCNACGLRWAKRNSSAPTRKDKKNDHPTKQK